MTSLGMEMLLMVGEGALWEVGGSSSEVSNIMADQEAVMTGLIGLGDPNQWAMLALARYRDVQSAEAQKLMAEPPSS